MKALGRGAVALLAGAAIVQDAMAQTAPAPAELPSVTVEGTKKKAARKKSPSPIAQSPSPSTSSAPAPQAPEPAPVAASGPTTGAQARAKSSADPKSETPLATQTSATQIQTQEISSISDLGITTEPGVDYSKRTDGPAIRGMDGPRILTVIDGIPIPYVENQPRAFNSTVNTQTNADGGSAAFDFQSLSALDVVRGADSSRIGSGALGGAIVLRTLEPEDLILEGRKFGGLAKTTYDTEDESITGALAVAAREGPLSILLQGVYREGHETDNKGNVDSYGATRTEPNPLDLDQDNVLFKIRHTSGSGHRIGVTAERFSRETDADLRSNWNRPVAQRFPLPPYQYNPYNYFGNDSTERERVSLDYSYLAPVPGGAIDTAFAKVYWQELKRDSGVDGTRNNGVFFLRDIAFEHEDIGFVGGLSGTAQTGPLTHGWRVGADFSDFTVNQFTTVIGGTALPSQADIPEIDGTKFGIYIDDRISLGNSRFALTPGLRFDWHEYTPRSTSEFDSNSGSAKFGFPGENSNSRVTPKVLATYDLAPQIELYAQWAASYRAPTVNELYVNFTNTGLYAQVGNPDLKPETGHGVELGANLGNLDFGGRITVFNNWYRNFITDTALVYDPAYPDLMLGVGSFENINEVEVSGVELRGHKLFSNGIRVHGSLAYAYGEDGDGNMLPTVAPFKGIAGIGYVSETWGVDFTGIFVGKYRDHFADGRRDTTFDAPSYAIANLGAWWEPTLFEGMRLQATVRNLFDETYYDALSVRNIDIPSTSGQPEEFYSAPGRSFIFSLTQRF